MATKSRTRVLRPLLMLFAVLGGLMAWVVAAGLEPRQGLDLRGGTSVILIPDPAHGQPSKGALEKAVDIIRQRVNGTGVSESEVVVEGGNIRVALPDVGREDALRIVGTTAELTFRHVEQEAGPAPVDQTPPSPSATPSAAPSATPSRTATATASPSAQSRPLSGALLGAQASPTPTGTATPSPTGSPTTGSGTGEGLLKLSDAEVTQLFLQTDCTNPEEQNIGSRFATDAPKIVSCNREGTAKYLLGPAEMRGEDVRDAVATIDTAQGGTGGWIVNLRFTRDGTKKFADITRKYVNQQVAIVLDGIVQSAPNINEPITGGEAQISGGDIRAKEAQDLANVLKYGSLPVVFDQSEGQTQTISPTLGRDSLNAGLLAGALGLALVVLYALLYYRGLGLVTVVGLLIFAAFNYVLVSILGELMGFTLTLAGIAGIIVSVGVTADSYVVFYERLKDEARAGKTLRQSVERGFSRAFRTLIAADIVSFLAAAILYFLSVGAVRGFAFTLGVATILDVVIAWFYTRPMVTLLTRTRLFTEGRFVGISTAVAGVPQTKEA